MQDTYVKKSNTNQGFTIVELLIVIVVVAILATIAIAAYTNINNRAYDSIVKNDLANLAKKFDLFKVEDGLYPDSVEDLRTLNVSVTRSAYANTPAVRYNLVACRKSNATSYSIAATSQSGKRFFISNETGLQEYIGANDWSHTGAYSTMCGGVLAGATYIGSGSSMYYNGEWRPWAN